MSAIGGSIESVTIANRNFSVAADADGQRKLGGFENEIQVNGDGTARKVMTRVAWMVSGLTLSVDDGNGDHEFLQERADAKVYDPISITYASGKTYSGTGTVSGEMQVGSQAQTLSVDLSGPGKLKEL
jgi:hypothetical protein